MPKRKDELYSILTSIDTLLKKQNSWKGIFIQGLVRGLGTTSGATVLLAVVPSLTIQFVDSLEWHTFFGLFLTN